MTCRLAGLVLAMTVALTTSLAQDAAVPAISSQPSIELLAPKLGRLSGREPTSGISYTRIFLLSNADAPRAPSPETPPKSLQLDQPTLTAQCTETPNHKQHFELFVNFGGVTDPAFYPPWHPTPAEQFPPATDRIRLTMEFLGYTKVKPVKRQFEKTTQPYGQLRYINPGLSSPNLEEFAFYLQYLRALPTLRISDGLHTAEFFTTPLVTQLHNEPLCHAAGV
jgi:hypothetical protein